MPHRLEQEAIDWADVDAATCDDACPYVSGKRYLNWQISDPKHGPIERVREIRNEIAGRVHELVAELDPERSAV